MTDYTKGGAPVAIHEERMKKKRKKKFLRGLVKVCLVLILLLLIASVLLIILKLNSGKVYDQLTVEAGSDFDITQFAKKGSIELIDGEPDLNVPGTYELTVKCGTKHTVLLIVEDTIAPEITAKDVNVSIGDAVDPMDFAESVTDATQVTAQLDTQVDTSLAGSYPVTVTFTDLGGNQTQITANLMVSPYLSEITLEAGSPMPSIEDLAIAAQAGTILTSEDDFATNHVGDTEIQISDNDITYTVTAHIVDTVAPIVTVKDLQAYYTTVLDGTEFIDSVEDATDVTASLSPEPDMTSSDPQEITITFSDEGGNTATATATLTLTEDTEAPVIACEDSVQINVGDSIIYGDLVTVTDNCFDQYTLDIEKSTVNVNAEGTYTATFTATDAAGNTSTRSMDINVIVSAYTQDQVDELADQVLADLITDSMTDKEKAEAIYTWVQSHVSYISHSDKGDWLKAAYEGLHDHQGDCYVFAMVSKELLTRAGVKNMDIEKIPAETRHYWNLVDYGEGWYHFDTTPRKKAHNFCLITDEELMEYSHANNNSHNYDPANYPEIQ